MSKRRGKTQLVVSPAADRNKRPHATMAEYSWPLTKKSELKRGNESSVRSAMNLSAMTVFAAGVAVAAVRSEPRQLMRHAAAGTQRRHGNVKEAHAAARSGVGTFILLIQ
eukprot:5139934-Pleurochrysis_carterae.AAC.1